MKIVIGFDGSEYSIKAIRFFYNFSHIAHEVYLVNVLELKNIALNTTDEYYLNKAKILNMLENEANKIKNELYKKGNNMVKIGVKILESTSIALAIIDFSKNVGADLIVVGSRGLGTVKKAFLGSVSSELAEKSPIPVLVVK